MIDLEQFEKIEMEYGCGYYLVCSDRGCPCAILTENKGFQEGIYKNFLNEQDNEESDDDYFELDFEDDFDPHLYDDPYGEDEYSDE